MDLQVPEFCDSPKEEKSSLRARSLLFRHEFEGVLVYDCYSRLSDATALQENIIQEAETIKKKCPRGYPEYDKVQYEKMKNYPPERTYIPQYTLVIPTDHTLIFDSKFESGNLYKAIKLNDNEYNLLIEYDTETLGHTQWYYFSVKNFKDQHTVRFNIINYMKYESLYSEGMKPLVYSTKKFESTGEDWHRSGFNLGYYQNTYRRDYPVPSCPSKTSYFYTLTFSYKFEYQDDLVFFAYSHPYTYSDLNRYLSTLYPKYQSILRITNFCKTLAGNPCYVLTITQNVETYSASAKESEKLHKSTAGRRYMKLKELKEEARIRLIEAIRGGKDSETGKG